MGLVNVRLLAKIFVLNQDGKVLLLQRSATDVRRPLGWDLPGGNIEQDEDPNQAVLRELQEETGMEAQDSQVILAASQTDPEYIVTILYKGMAVDDTVALSHEHQAYRWVDPSAISQFDMPEKYKRGAALLK